MRLPLPQDRAHDVLRDLRERTRASHTALEQALDLVSDDVRAVDLRRALEGLLGVWRPLEAALDRWHAEHRLVDWPARRRSDRIAGDLAALGVDASSVPDCPDAPRPTSTAEALGCLYVLDGSALGGRVVNRHLRAMPSVPPEALTFFADDPRAGRLWQETRRTLDAHLVDAGDRETALASAEATFATLLAWCRRDPVPA